MRECKGKQAHSQAHGKHSGLGTLGHGWISLLSGWQESVLKPLIREWAVRGGKGYQMSSP